MQIDPRPEGLCITYQLDNRVPRFIAYDTSGHSKEDIKKIKDSDFGKMTDRTIKLIKMYVAGESRQKIAAELGLTRVALNNQIWRYRHKGLI